MGFVRCKVKCKHLLKTVRLILKDVQMTAEGDMKHVLPYVVYMVTDRKLVKKINSEDPTNFECRTYKLLLLAAIGTAKCDFFSACRMVGRSLKRL
jgi:hypothetical protein